MGDFVSSSPLPHENQQIHRLVYRPGYLQEVAKIPMMKITNPKVGYVRIMILSINIIFHIIYRFSTTNNE